MKRIFLLIFSAGVLLAAFSGVFAQTAPATAPAAPTAGVDVVEWSIFVADVAESQLNRREAIDDSLPDFVNDLRKPVPVDAADAPPIGTPGPIGVLRLHPVGKVAADATMDVKLTLSNGRALGHWPPAKVRTQSLLWQDIHVVSSPNLLSVPQDHWFYTLRQEKDSALTVGNTSEPFLLYDVELNYAARLDARATGENEYHVWHRISAPMLDLTFYKKDAGGKWLTAYLPKLKEAIPSESFTGPAGVSATQGASSSATVSGGGTTTFTGATLALPPGQAGVGQLVVTGPAGGGGGNFTAAGTAPARAPNALALAAAVPTEAEETPIALAASAATDASVLGSWRAKLSAAGVTPTDQDLALKILGRYALDAKRLTAIYQIDPGELEKMLPLEIVPQPRKISRIGLVVVRGFDPALGAEVDALIAQLGDARWEKREAAMQEIKKLGAIAKPKLIKATSDKDLEVVVRAEQLLQILSPPPPAAPN